MAEATRSVNHKAKKRSATSLRIRNNLKNTIMKAISKKEKIQMIVKLVEIMVNLGFDISDIIGKPLSYFDYEKISIRIETLKHDYKIE